MFSEHFLYWKLLKEKTRPNTQLALENGAGAATCCFLISELRVLKKPKVLPEKQTSGV